MARTRAVLLDALGTLVELDDPAPRLRAALRDLAGVDVGLPAAERGFGAEIGYYLANQMRGGDQAGLERLRDDCATAMRDALLAAIGDAPAGDGVRLLFGEAPDAAAASAALDHATVRAAMLDALAFRTFDDVLPALRDLRERGLRLVVVSNWDCSLPEWLDRAGIGPLVDGSVSSAVVGEAKPAPAVFEAGLRLAGCDAAEALFVGDSVDNDVRGARAAGLRAVLIQRAGDPPPGVEAVRSLGELSAIV
ncbi:MAG TPA: HAD family hydrolase [Thermoleophilaceae bacterium]|nr:HAD family hydrolase [Thermoleophilaceae bacterium]